MKKRFFNRISSAVYSHKIISAVVVVIIFGGVYYAYAKFHNSAGIPQYAVTRARIGSIVETVTGSGQVSAQNQIDITSQVSGAISSIRVKVGDRVETGTLIATIDPSQAATNLENARIALNKLLAPPKISDLSSAENSLNKAYSDAMNTVSAFFLDMPSVLSGLKDLYYGQNTFLSESNASNLNSTSYSYRQKSGILYDSVAAQFIDLSSTYKTIGHQSSTSSIEDLLAKTYALSKNASEMLQQTDSTINHIITSQPYYDTSRAATARTNVNTWSTTINNDTAALLGAMNAIQSNTNTLANLKAGTDPLDIATQRLNVANQERTYANYFIRAPFAGIIGRLPVSAYGQASNGTLIATVIGDKKIATISLNEIDAAKVHTGDPVMVTFDAIDDLHATGTVSEVDLVGTVSQGVVSYYVKIALNTNDQRILPGMTVNTTIEINRRNNTLVIPTTALKTSGNRTYAQVFDTLPNTASGTSTKENSAFNFRNSSINISSATPPRDQVIETGLSDENNVEVTSGLSSGTWVVTRTITGSSNPTTQAPSLLNTLGGNRNQTNGRAGATFFRR